MKINCFVFAWNEFVDAALELEKTFKSVDIVTKTIYSGVQSVPEHWVHIEEPYYSAKWNKSLELLDGDIYIQVQADVRFENAAQFVERALALLANDDVGSYEPDVDIGFVYLRHLLSVYSDDVYEIPMVDGISFALKSEIARKLPPVRLEQNRLGWGITPALSAICHLNGKRCVRDYRVKTMHRHERSYSKPEALAQRTQWLATLDASLRQEIENIYVQMGRASRRNQQMI